MFDCGEDHSVVEQNPYVVKNTKQRCIEYLERAETIKKKLVSIWFHVNHR